MSTSTLQAFGLPDRGPITLDSESIAEFAPEPSALLPAASA
jgi:hypothetical protein